MKYLLLLFFAIVSFAVNAQESDADMRTMRKALLSQQQDADKIIFKAIDEQYRVTVFTDITCGYCAKFHRQIDTVNHAGITVEYLAFPRDGLGSQTLQAMQAIWCSPNKNALLTMAKTEGKVPIDSCQGQQVVNQYLLGASLGVYGTPTFILPNGEMRAGYLSPEALISVLTQQ